MSPVRTLFSIVALVLTLAACDETIIGDDNGIHRLSLHNGIVTSTTDGQPDATINAAGDLHIGTRTVIETPSQRDALKKYFEAVVAIRTAGIETGKAGAAMAGHAIGDVAAGLAHGDPDSIGPKIDARAKDIEAKAMVICKNLASLQAAQDAVIAGLPEFKPYATIADRDDSDCHSRVTKRG